MKTYECTMDDGTRLEVKAASASDAMQGALNEHLGHRVVKCRWGKTEEECVALSRYTGIKYPPG